MTNNPIAVWDELYDTLDEFLERGEEINVTFEIETECAWSGTLRWTKHPNNPGVPDRSVVFHAAGGAYPEDTAARLLEALRQELAGEIRPDH